MKKINWTAICFSVVFLVMLVIRIKTLEAIDIAFYALAVAGFIIMGIVPILYKSNKK